MESGGGMERYDYFGFFLYIMEWWSTRFDIYLW